jgi:hypothetical protein
MELYISRRPSHGQLRCCPQAFLRIFYKVTYIRTVENSSLLKIYTLPNHTIIIGVCILETQLLGLLYGGGASFVQKWSMPWMSANRWVHFLLILRFLWSTLIVAASEFVRTNLENTARTRKIRYELGKYVTNSENSPNHTGVPTCRNN